MLKFRFFHFLLFLLLVTDLGNIIQANEPELRFKHLTTKDGLSNNLVYCIAQDSREFIWVGTADGLNRYDGYQNRIFKRQMDDTTSLADNMIFDLHIDHMNQLWVGTQNGLCLYNSNLEAFSTYYLDTERHWLNTANRVTGIREDSKNNLYAVTEIGILYKYSASNQNFLPYPNDFVSVKAFQIDDDDVCWLGGLNGFYSFNLKSETYTEHFYKASKAGDDSISIKAVNTIFVEGDTIWIGTIQGDILYLNKENIQVKQLDFKFEDTYFIYDIFKDSKGLLYFATANGLYSYDKKKKSYQYYTQNEYDNAGLNSNGVTCLFEDVQKNLWIGTYQGGVNFVTSGKAFINYNRYSKELTLDIINIASILESSDGKVWLGSFDLGLSYYDPASGESEVFFSQPDNPSSLGYGSVLNIFEDSRNNIWVGTYLGDLQRFDPVNGEFISYPFISKTGRSSKGRDVRSIAEDQSGSLWVISHGNGMYHLNPESGDYKQYIRDDHNLENTIADDWAFQILSDHEGVLWIATPSGLSRFQIENEKFTNYYHDPHNSNSLCNNYINVLYEDSFHYLWIGTKFGLSAFSPDRTQFQHFFTQDGLPSNQINSIIENTPGEIWLSTGYGLSRMNYETEDSAGSLHATFRNYDESDNLQDIVFWDRAVEKTKNGELIFGCEEGIVKFDPASIVDNTVKPKVYLTDFKLFNRSIKPQDNSNILVDNISQTKKLDLEHNQNFFSFEYVAINYIAMEKNRFRYKLEGFDADWIEAGNKREASYTNVGPGKYTFRVIASNNDGYWNNEGTSVEIHISPPLSGQWWFRILSSFMVISLVVLYYLQRTKKLKGQNILLERRVKSRTEELSELNEKIKEQNEQLGIQKSNIELAYEELSRYRTKLEDLVDERTQELIVQKERAEAADKLKTSFLANLSHEIRTPLNAIIGFSGLMLDPDITDEERLSFKTIIEGSNNTLLSLINDIIDFSKIESGHLDIALSEVSLQSVLDDLHKIFSLEINKVAQDQHKDIEFRLNIDKDIRDVLLITDEIRLKQLLSNLINNAIKFTDKGVIEAGCALVDANTIKFYVSDTGIGIEEKYHKIIFERFRKLEENAQLFRGAGLGLSISYELVKMLGGEMKVESKPGKGSTFSFTTPIKIGESKERISSFKMLAKELPNLYDKVILIAEDDFANYAYLEKLIRRTKATVLHATDGAEAIELGKSNSDIDLVLMDIKMPVKDGFEALDSLRKSGMKAPVIAQTAYAFSDEIRRIKEAGFDGYISKPINSIELYKIINKHI